MALSPSASSRQPSPVTATRTVLVIPGLGGHPVFHEHLISGLREEFSVCSAPHRDFAAQPCTDWERHVDYWEDQLRSAAQGASAPPAVVGISFGAHIAHALRLRQPSEARDGLRLTLVSYRHLTRLERRLLRGLSPDSSLTAGLVGGALFRWSEQQVQDRDRLVALRGELYDDRRSAQRRLTARLRALASAPELRPAGDQATYVFGAEERGLLRRHERRGGSAVTVPGGHDCTVRRSPELLEAAGRGSR